MAVGFVPVSSLVDAGSQENKFNGFYLGPKLEDGFQHVVRYFESQIRVPVTVLTRPSDGSVRIAIDFHIDRKNSANNLSAQAAFIRNPDDWGDGYDHHAIISSQYGCAYRCRMCVDGLDGSWKGNLSPEQMAYAAYRASGEAGGISQNAKIKMLMTGSGDPLANGARTATLIRNAHQIPGIGYVHTSTTGAFSAIPKIIEATTAANEHGIGAALQVSVHATTEEQRLGFMSYPPNVKILQLFGAAEHFYAATGINRAPVKNRAYINYMCVPELGSNPNPATQGWNTTDNDAAFLAQKMPKGVTLKLVALNPVKDLERERDVHGNIYVSKFDPALENTRDEWGNKVNQIIIPEYLQVQCMPEVARAHVLWFANRVAAEAASCGNSFTIITPEDRACVVGAECGSVGKTVPRHMAASLTM